MNRGTQKKKSSAEWWAQLKERLPNYYERKRQERIDYMKRYYLSYIRKPQSEINKRKLNLGVSAVTDPKEYKKRYYLNIANYLRPNRIRKPNQQRVNIIVKKVPGVKQSTEWWREFRLKYPEEHRRRLDIINAKRKEKRRLKNLLTIGTHI